MGITARRKKKRRKRKRTLAELESLECLDALLVYGDSGRLHWSRGAKSQWLLAREKGRRPLLIRSGRVCAGKDAVARGERAVR
jgi:hypothetical protein